MSFEGAEDAYKALSGSPCHTPARKILIECGMMEWLMFYSMPPSRQIKVAQTASAGRDELVVLIANMMEV